jgi:hypothetical protein
MHAVPRYRRSDDLPYIVEQWDDADRYVKELIALTGDYRVARAAFEEAARRRGPVGSSPCGSGHG